MAGSKGITRTARFAWCSTLWMNQTRTTEKIPSFVPHPDCRPLFGVGTPILTVLDWIAGTNGTNGLRLRVFP